jgi:hypothetical protein
MWKYRRKTAEPDHSDTRRVSIPSAATGVELLRSSGSDNVYVADAAAFVEESPADGARALVY